MKDEKMAEEKFCKGCKLRMEQCLWAWRNTNGLNEPNEKNCSCKEVPAFLAGLKAGRPQWHDLEKDPNDLPKGYAENTRFLCSVKGETLFLIRYGSFWQGNFEVDAWCEIPTFDKE